MPDLSHVAVLKQGVEVWNGWRQRYPELRPDLSGFRAAEIPQILWEDSSLNCHAVQFRGADFSRTNLVDANFYAQNLLEVDLTDADFTNGRLSDATLKLCTAKRALFCSANLKVFGLSTWSPVLVDVRQNDLVITPSTHEQAITVNDLNIANIAWQWLSRDITIDPIKEKVVLILERFTIGKEVLNAIDSKLRNSNYIPIIFDVPQPKSLNTLEMVSYLGRSSRFVLADVTEATGVQAELATILQFSPSLPVQPLLRKGGTTMSLAASFKGYRSYLPLHVYKDEEDLLRSLPEIVARAEDAARILQRSVESEGGAE